MEKTDCYNSSTTAKTCYHPVDAALRWCNLLDQHTEILQTLRHRYPPPAQPLSRWPGLQDSMEKIFDALRNGELHYGCLGISVPRGTLVDYAQLTIRHLDLKNWMACHYPEERPAFLFGDPNDLPGLISVKTYLVLQADRDALQLQLAQITAEHHQVLSALAEVGIERNNLKDLLHLHDRLSDRSELTYQRIIGGLIHLLLGRSPGGQPYSVFSSQSAVVSALLAHFSTLPGMTKRTLDAKFAAGRRSLELS